MGETFILKLFFKPLVEPSSRSNQQLFSENTSYYLFPRQDRAMDRLSLLHTAGTIREQFGNRYARTVW